MANTKRKVKAKVVASDTKMDKARALYAANSKLERKEMIALLISKVKLTPAGASTYYQKLASGDSGHVAGKRGRPMDPKSAAGRARALYPKLVKEGKTRGQIIKIFRNRFGLTPAGAATYVQSSKTAMAA